MPRSLNSAEMQAKENFEIVSCWKVMLFQEVRTASKVAWILAAKWRCGVDSAVVIGSPDHMQGGLSRLGLQSGEAPPRFRCGKGSCLLGVTLMDPFARSSFVRGLGARSCPAVPIRRGSRYYQVTAQGKRSNDHVERMARSSKSS